MSRPVRSLLGAVFIALAAAVWIPASAQAAFGPLPGAEGFQVAATEENGKPDGQAGSHPYALTTSVDFNLAPESAEQPGGPFTDGDLRDLSLELPPGLIENPAVVSRCSISQFNTPRESPFQHSLSGESCPVGSQIGVVTVHTSFGGGSTRTFGVFNLAPPPGSPSEFGFSPFGVPIIFVPHIRQANGEYGLTLEAHNISQRYDVYGFKLTLWGTPWLVVHDNERGNCLNEVNPAEPFGEPAHLEPELGGPPPYAAGTCSVGDPKSFAPEAYLTLPTSCGSPMSFSLAADSWQQGLPVDDSTVARDENGNPLSPQNCDLLAFHTVASLGISTDRTTTATGLSFGLEINDEDAGLVVDSTPTGRIIPGVRAPSQTQNAVVSLPLGMTINPSVGAGLGVCTPAGYAAETVSSPPGAGCPNASKIGEFTVQSPLYSESIAGSIFLAEPDNPLTTTPGAENPFDSLVALYLVAKAPQRGILVKVAGQLKPDPTTGQLTATFDDLPQIPYTNLLIHFRDGQRSPLVTPSTCGGYIAPIELAPWVDHEEILHSFSSFILSSGLGGEACPAGVTPFAPGAKAGTLNSQAGAYTPFYLHLTRSDADQEITSYSTVLPPGLLGRIAGIPFCSDAEIEAAKRRRGFEEAEHPSCPAASEIGHTTTGYGLGGVLAYAPGKLYLAGPYHGQPLSIVAIDPALVGPFDLGVIVVRSAIHVDPQTAQVSIDPDASDPIPHIREGIPLHLRDIRVYISRPDFTVNPTDCEPLQVTSGLTGSSPPFTNPISASASVPDPFQVSNCSALGFAPQLSLKLLGPTKRNGYPKLRAELHERSGDANIAKTEVVLPHTEFLAQEHIRTVCTQKQFAAEACPAGSIYGHARAYSPLLSEPLEGPVLLRSGSHTLPDMVVALKGEAGIAIDLSARIDQSHGGMRATFESLPDGTADKFVLTLFGGKRGLLINSANVCRTPGKATASFTGQDGATYAPKIALANQCKRPGHKSHRAQERRS